MLPHSAIKGISHACDLLYSALNKQLKIVIIGDYDVDGATSTSVMVSGLREIGFKSVDFLIPNRLVDGYGLTPILVDRAVEMNADMIITVDNGIVSHQGVQHAKDQGLDILITDHHLAGEHLPDAVIVNPNQPGCRFESKSIAGVGVAFYVLIALRSYLREKKYFEKGPNLLKYLDLVALGTVADCVKLDENNRIMVAQGLSLMRSGKARPGIQALIKIARRSPCLLEADDMGFSIAPRLNAAGRLEDMSIGVRCLLAETKKEAESYARRLDEINLQRREMQQEMTESALKYASTHQIDQQSVSIIHQPNCHEGIIGLVASMIKERFNRPSIVLTEDHDGEILKGSCRSITGVNIRDVLADYDRQYPGSLVKFGGHAMAAGLSLKACDFDQFKHTLESLCQELVSEDLLQKRLWVDGSLPKQYRTIGFARKLIDMGPWGIGFEKPLFYDRFELCEQHIVGGKHLKLCLSDGQHLYDGICFNVNLNDWPNHSCHSVDIAYHLQINEFNERRKLQFMVIDIQSSSQLTMVNH